MSDVDVQIEAQLNFFVEKFNAGQIEDLVNGFFTEDCIVTGSEVPFLVGRRAAAAVFNQVHSMQEGLNFEVVETRKSSGGLHYSVVQTRSKMKGDGSDSNLKSLAIFRETKDGLLCEVDFFTSGIFE